MSDIQRTENPLTSSSRVVIVAGQLDIGGAERELVTFLEAAHSCRFEFQVICLASGGEFRADVEQFSGSAVLTPPTASKLGRLRWMWRTLRSLNPALVHCWNLFPILYIPPSHWRSYPLIGFLQCIPSQWPAGILTKRVLRRLVRVPEGLVSNSSAALDELALLGIPTGPSVVVRNGVRSSFFDGSAGEEFNRISGQDTVLIGLGRLIDRKRADWMIRALAILRKERLPLSLWLVGDGAERVSLAHLAEELGVESKVVFWGNRNDVPDLLSAADIMVHCAWAEGLPNAVQEAMAAGLPIVASRTSGIPEIVEDSVEGILFDPDDFNGFVGSLRKLVSDADLQVRMGSAARKKAQRDFSPETMAIMMIEFYETILGSWSGKRGIR